MTIAEFRLQFRLWHAGKFKKLLPVVCSLMFCLVSAQIQAQRNSVGNGKRESNLQNRISINWKDVDLAGALDNLSTNQDVDVFLDRRVDPGTRINFEAVQLPVGCAVYQLAEQAGCGVCWIGDVAYVGDLHDVQQLAMRRDELLNRLSRLGSASNKRKWFASSSWNIQRLSEPNALVEEILSQVSLDLEIRPLPHDLLRNRNFESISRLDRLVLISFGFERFPSFDDKGNLIGLTDFQPREAGSKSLRLPTGSSTTIIKKVREQFGDSVSVRGRVITVEGTGDTLYRIERMLLEAHFEAGRKSNGSGNVVVSARLRGSRGSALKTAAVGLGVELKYDPSLRPILLEQIDITVKKVTHRELVARVLAATDLEFQVTSQELIIRPK